MDEMNNMNEVTTEETSNEVTPVVTENNEVKTEEKFHANPFVLGLAGAGLVVGGVAYAAKKLRDGKGEKKEKKGKKEKKPKKHVEFCKPWRVVEDEPEEIEDVDFNEVEETEEEN